MFKNISEFFKGYVRIKVCGNFCEKFLNILLKNKIVIKEIKRISEKEIILTIYVKDFIKVKSASKVSGCKIHISKKTGAGFTAFLYRKRIILFSGIALCFVLVYTMSNMIFSIEIKGNYQLSTEYIMNLLSANGIRPFMFKNNSGSDAAKRIMSDNENIAWIGIDITGSKVIVDIVEKPDIPEVYDPMNKFNIVASCDGVISDFFLKKGFAVAGAGDTVKKGQLIVSGVTDSATQQIRYINPEADIRLICWISEQSSQPIVKEVENLTNNKITNTYLKINDSKIGIIRRIPYKYYNIKTDEINLPFNIKLIKTVNIENIPEKIVYDEKELFEIERKKLYNNIISRLTDECKILNVDASYDVDGELLNTTVVCTVEGPFTEKSAINE